MLVRETFVVGRIPVLVVVVLGVGQAIIDGEGVDINIVALVCALMQRLFPSGDLQCAVPYAIAKINQQPCRRGESLAGKNIVL